MDATLLGKKIRNHLIHSLIGEGGMGVVYKALEQKNGDVRAIKFMRKIHQQQEKRFIQEAAIGKRLSHPNLVQILELGKLKNHPMFSYFMIMEYVDGKSLREKSILTNFRIIEIFVEICTGLTAIHNAKLVHRDLKPSNILITQDGEVKITDLGVVKFNEETQFTKTGAILGTPAYMSPEQCRDSSRVDHRSDIYSLGVMMFEMFANRLPFKGPSDYNFLVQHSFQIAPSLREFNAELPPILYEMIEKMLEKNPENRYQSAGEIADVLRRVSRELLDPDVPKVSRPKREEPPTLELVQATVQIDRTPQQPTLVGKRETGIFRRIFPGFLRRGKKTEPPSLTPNMALQKTSKRVRKELEKTSEVKAKPDLAEGSFQDQLRSIAGKTGPLPKLSRGKKETKGLPRQKGSKEQLIAESKAIVGNPGSSASRRRERIKDEQVIAESKATLSDTKSQPSGKKKRTKD